MVIEILEEEVEEAVMPFDLAGAGSRLISLLIDFLILFVVGIVLTQVSMSVNDVTFALILGLLSVFIQLAYFTYFFGNGQTTGMGAMKIKLIGISGTYPIGYGKGFLRWIGMIVSAIPFYLVFIWILIDKKKQGWHDKIAGTYVVKE